MASTAIQASLESQTVRLEHFICLLQQISETTAVHKDPLHHRTLLHASVIKVINSGIAAQLLAQAGCVEEILSIGRTMVEVSVNAAYLQHASDREVNRFLHFHPEAGNQLGGRLPSLAAPRSQDNAISRLGKRIMRGLPTPPCLRVDPSWSNRSLLDRALIADHASHIPVMSLLVRRCYPRGHASMLGSVGSLDYFISALQGTDGANPDNRTAALTEALFGINLCLFTLAFYLSEFFGLGLDHAIEEAANAESARPLESRGIASLLDVTAEQY